jgi:23S rRNA pseudouridine2605 synthase
MQARPIACIARPMAETRPDPRPDQRIAKLLARAGVASRREIERMIAEGRVALDGVALDTPATLLRSLRGVTVDGKPVAAAPPARLFLFHKPNGVLVTERDPAGRPTIYDRLPPDLPRLVPVGRLDYNTEGLLLLTTDGGLKRQLELPANGVERAYRARAFGEVSQDQLEELIEGVEIDGVRYGPIDANLERRTGANTWVEMILTEGKNREVRRVLEHLGLQVSRLLRTRYGPFVLGDLEPGQIGEVRQHDLVAFRRSLEKRLQPEGRIAVDARAPEAPQAAPPIERPARAPARTAPTTAKPGRTERRPDEKSAPAGPGGRRARPAVDARPLRLRGRDGAAREPDARPAPPTGKPRPERAGPVGFGKRQRTEQRRRAEQAEGAPQRPARRAGASPGATASRPDNRPTTDRRPGRPPARAGKTDDRRPASPRDGGPPRPPRPGAGAPRRPGKR